MKKTLFSLIFSVFILQLSAQINPEQKDWLILDITYDHMLDGPSSLSNEIAAPGFSLAIFQDKPFGHGRFGMAYGLAYTWNRNYSNLGITTDLNTGDEAFSFLDTDSIESNRLRRDYIDLLFELRFRTKPNSKGRFFRWYVGGKGGVRIYSFSRTISDKASFQFNDLGALNRLRYGVYTRIGYSYINLYAYYGLSGLFGEGTIVDEGADFDMTAVRPISLGLSFTF